MAYYYYEYCFIRKAKAKSPIRIAVTGSRGKSTTVKFLCSLFRNTNQTVLGKVTGSDPFLILPDGSYQTIERRSKPSILEQKRVLLKTALALKPDVLITEIMSVTPEYQAIETKNIVDPETYIITNVKEDHLGVTGNSKSEIADAFIKAAPKNSTVLCLSEAQALFKNVEKVIEFIPGDKEKDSLLAGNSQPGFDETIRIAKRICKNYGISESIMHQTLKSFRFDQNVFFHQKLTKDLIVVNAFNANDVESTKTIFCNLKDDWPDEFKIIGIFSTRSDKVTRSKQWIKSLANDDWAFDELIVFGPHFAAIKRQKLPFKCSKLKEKNIESYFKSEHNCVFFGFGNYVNCGEKLVEAWQKMGEIS